MSPFSPPLFAVLVPLYNAGQFLGETVESLRAQTFEDFEVVFVDDGSSDDTAEQALQVVREDPRFHLIRTPNRGIAESRNTAARHSSAPWLAICDGDDLWLPEKLALQARYIASWPHGQGVLAAVGTAGTMINALGRPYGPIGPPARPWPHDPPGPAEDAPIIMINSSVVLRRELFFEVGGYRSEYRGAEDLDLWLRLRHHGALVNLPEPVTQYRMHGLNLSHRSHVDMQLSARRAYANAARRLAGEPELSPTDFLERWRLGDPHFSKTVGTMYGLMHFNLARVNLHNGRPAHAALALLRAGLVSPGSMLRLVTRSRAWRRLWAFVWRPGSPQKPRRRGPAA